MRIKLSDYVWNYIAERGTQRVFMFPGGGAMHLLDSLGRSENLKGITLLHEQACAMAAETYTRVAGQMGAILVTTGPGGTNAITGVAAAWMESTPMLIISGQVKTSDLKDETGVRQLGSQEIGIVDIVRSITKYAVMIRDPQTIRYHLDRAYAEAAAGRPGPVWLDIPLDVQAAMIDTDTLEGFIDDVRKNAACPREQIRTAAEMIIHARRPVLIAGQGIERGRGKSAFSELVSLLEIPVITSWMATELLPYDNKYNFGKPGMVAPRYSNYSMQESDLVISIGTRLDPAMIGYDPSDFAPGAKKIIVDIDAHELEKFRFPIDLKVSCDAAGFIQALTTELKQAGYSGREKQDWLCRCLEIKEKYPIVMPEYREQEHLVNPYHFIDKLSDCLAGDDVIIPGSSGATIDVFWLCMKNRSGQRLMATGALGSMGYGLPAAIGACVASQKRTICVEGDGSLQLNIQELANVKGLNLPIKLFILDNGGYLSIMNMQRSHFNARYTASNRASGLYIPDIVKVAQAYGISAFQTDSHSNMVQAIQETLASDGPALCRVVMRDDISIQPKVQSRVTEDGSMLSGSLSHMWPFIEEI